MILFYLLTALHVVVCIFLILVVLLQSGKGADLAGAFGGSATQTAFGSHGPASFLSKLTTVSAVLFMATCLSLSMIGGKTSEESILDSTKGATAPSSKTPAQTQPAAAPLSPEEIKKRQEEIEKKQSQAPAPSSPETKKNEAAPAPAPEKKAPEGSKKP